MVQVKEPYDWVCMCCVAKVGSNSPSAMSSDWCIAVVEHAHLLSNEHEPHLIMQNSSYLQDNVPPVAWIEDDSAGAGAMDTIIEASQLQEPMKSYPTPQITITEKYDREMSQGILDGLSDECIGFCTSSYEGCTEGSKVVRRGNDKMKPLNQVVNIVSEAKTANNFKNKCQHGRGNMDYGTTAAAHSYNSDIPLDSGITNELTLKKTKTNLKVKCNEKMKIKRNQQISPTQSKAVERTAATEEGNEVILNRGFLPCV